MKWIYKKDGDNNNKNKNNSGEVINIKSYIDSIEILKVFFWIALKRK